MSLLCTACIAVAVLPVPAARAAQRSVTFSFTGAEQTFVVPPDVRLVTVEAWGAQGGNENSGGPSGGYGGYAASSLIVTPGEVLTAVVGGQGQGAATATNPAGGWPDGGNGGALNPAYDGNASGAGGGGSSRVHRSGETLVQAGGGGGSGGWGFDAATGGAGGSGGGAAGADGATGAPAGGSHPGLGGGGATLVANGQGGTAGGNTASDGQSGVGNVGGAGGRTGRYWSGGGGGGGGGWLGGGGGGGGGHTEPAGAPGWSGAGGGGGGGSGFVSGTNTAVAQGQRSGHGQVTITWTPVIPPQPLPPCSSSATRVDTVSGSGAGYSFTVDVHHTPTAVEVCTNVKNPAGGTVFEEDVVVPTNIDPSHLIPTLPTVDPDAPPGDQAGSPCVVEHAAGGTTNARAYVRTSDPAANEPVVCFGVRGGGTERHVRVTVH